MTDPVTPRGARPAWDIATRVVRAGTATGDAAVVGAPLLAGPTFAGVYLAPGDPAAAPYTYGRYHNPTWTAYERALGELEGSDGADAVVFASGMAAVTAVFGTVLRPGDVVVLPADGYYTARSLATGHLAEIGVVTRLATLDDLDAARAALDGARLLWVETPTNPGLAVRDLALLADAARAAGALVAVDNTTATPLGQTPLALGADFSVASDTKAMTGHGDLVLGHVAARDPAWVARLRQWRTLTGAVPGPMEVWLAHRSLATLDVRLERMCTNALAVAELLARHPAVRGAWYPGLPGDPAHALARRQMRRFGPVVGFELADAGAAARFLSAARLVTEATSFGGVHTTAERRARWGGDAVPEGFIRLSAGLEGTADLLDDVSRALALVRP